MRDLQIEIFGNRFLFMLSAESKHVDGHPHWAWAIKAGERGHPGGATCWKSVKGSGVVVDSMTVNETMALLQLSKIIVCFRHAAEEVAGLDPLGDVTDDIIFGSDNPTPTFVSKELVTTLTHNEPGLLGHKAADMASIIINNQHPATWIGEDNQGTVNVVNHVSAQNKSLKRITRVTSHVMSLIDEQLIQVQLVPASEQEADQLSKPCISPLDEWR